MSLRVAACFHGFLRTGASMWWVARRLQERGYSKVALPTFGYHLRSIEENARAAAAVITRLHEAHPEAEIDVVTHSYGGVLARALPGELPIRRLVMLSPPNHGAVAADKVRSAVPVHRVGWDPLGQILPGVPENLPLPRGELGILTGGLGHPRGFNPLLGADNDGTVRVDEARLDGAADFLVVPVLHAMMPMSPRSLSQVEAFLAEGRFRRDSSAA